MSFTRDPYQSIGNPHLGFYEEFFFLELFGKHAKLCDSTSCPCQDTSLLQACNGLVILSARYGCHLAGSDPEVLFRRLSYFFKGLFRGPFLFQKGNYIVRGNIGNYRDSFSLVFFEGNLKGYHHTFVVGFFAGIHLFCTRFPRKSNRQERL